MKKQTKLFKEKKKKKMKKVKKKIKIKKNCRSIVTKNKENERSEPLERCASGRRRWRQNKQKKKWIREQKYLRLEFKSGFYGWEKWIIKHRTLTEARKSFLFLFFISVIFLLWKIKWSALVEKAVA